MIDRVGGGDGEAEGADAGGALQWNGDDFGTRGMWNMLPYLN